MMKKIITMFAALMTMVSMVYAFDFSATVPSGQTLYFSVLSGNDVAIVGPNSANVNAWNGYTRPTGALVIPATIEEAGITYNITTVDEYAFVDCEDITSVVFSAGMRDIKARAFIRCYGITSVTFSNTITTIGAYGFQACESLVSVVLPESLTTLETRAFSGCTDLQSIQFPASTMTTLAADICRNDPALTDVVIPASVESIGTGAFASCPNLRRVIMKRTSTPTTIGSTTFSNHGTGLVVVVDCGYASAYRGESYYDELNVTEACAYTITLNSSNNTMGLVAGGGTYNGGDIVLLSAYVQQNYSFRGWNNGVVDNPYNMVVTGDTTITALFDYKDTAYIHDTAIVTDTLIDTLYIHDTTIVHDTAIMHDTNTLLDTIYIHDTTIVTDTFFVHDTTVLNDTVYINRNVYVNVTDTLYRYINNYIHDTTFVNRYVYDTIYLYINNYIHDTTFVTRYVYDTIYLTRYIHDTIYIHDQTGIDDKGMSEIKIYSENAQVVVEGVESEIVNLYDANGRLVATKHEPYATLRFDIPNTGVYIVRIGNRLTQRIMIVK